MTVVSCSDDEEPTTKTYTVTFDSQGGSEVSNQRVNEGEKATVPETPTKEGFTFDAWYTSTDYATRWDFTKDVVTKDLTLYARWTANSFTVTFNTNGGSAIDAIEVAEGGLLTEIPTPVKEGFTFAGWYTDEELTEEFNDENPITADIILYAKWEQGEPVQDVTLEELEALVGTTNELYADAYTDESYGAMSEKLNAANQIINAWEQSSQADRNKAYKELKEAIDALVALPVTDININVLGTTLDNNEVYEFAPAQYSNESPFTLSSYAVTSEGSSAANPKVLFEYTPGWEQWAMAAPETSDGYSLKFVPKTDLADGTEIVITVKSEANPEITKKITLKAIVKNFKTLFLEVANSLPETVTVSNFKEVLEKCQKAKEYYDKLTDEEKESTEVSTAYNRYTTCNAATVRDFDYFTYTYNTETQKYSMKDRVNRNYTYSYEPDSGFPVGLYYMSWTYSGNDSYSFGQQCILLKNDGSYVKGIRYSNEKDESGYPTGGNPTEILDDKEEGNYHVDGDSNSGMLVMEKK